MQTHHSVSSLYDHIVGLRAPAQSTSILGLNEAQRIWLVALLVQAWLRNSSGKSQRLIFVHSDPKKLQELVGIVAHNVQFSEPLLELHAQQFWGLHRFTNQSDIRSERLRTMTHLLANVPTPAVIFATFSGLMQKTAAPEIFEAGLLHLESGREYDLDQLLENLDERGYRKVDQVEEVGQYAVRGGLLDFFSPALDAPVRSEFLADTLQTLKTFAPDSQLSLQEIHAVCIVPLWEQLIPKSQRQELTQKLYEALLEQKVNSADRQGIVDAFAAGHPLAEMPLLLPALRNGPESSAIDYLRAGDVLFFLDSIESCREKYKANFEHLRREANEDASAQRPGLPPESHFFKADAGVLKIHKDFVRIECGDLVGTESSVQRLQSLPPESWRTSLSASPHAAGIGFWMEKLLLLQEQDQRVLILVRQEEHLLRLKSLLQHHNLTYSHWIQAAATAVNAQRHDSLTVTIGALPQMIWEERDGLLILPEHIIFGESFQPVRRRKRTTAASFRAFQDLESGSLVVHSDHGIGRYIGMRTMDLGGIRTDFLVIEYADQDKLYVPVHRLNLLQRYSKAADNDESAAVDKLKSTGWAKRKARARKAIQDMADQLLKIYAQRKLAKGHAFSQPSDEYYQFEADFTYIETPDQQKAIDDVNADLSSPQPMDRLVCGDVGFGKTEVALRASMRAVLDGFQVIILAPTTLLSYQHWETFKARFKRYGVEVGLANRFVKAEEIKRNLAAFASGRLDILIGTHRLLSKDIIPKNLGLLVVDEEQRFGVAHKEAIKNLRSSCDILTLTATPIPRSLHMALLGIRDISVIATPPSERIAIKTYVAQFDEDLIKKAVLQEVQRGGQVFFVHNRVRDILEMQLRLQKLLPNISIAVAHGQMKENNVESVIIDFIQQKYTVLLCTTIIESGIDMPNVNTIIINNADRFGLAQLYQMRGRVGRSSRQSYAYFLTSGTLVEREEARQRLEILAAHQELGVGFQIASHDMELRGTGNLLGGEQSGQMADVGYDLFLEMLEKEIATIQGEEKEPDLDPEIKIPVSASLSSSYIVKEKQRLMIYKSLFSSAHLEDVERLAAEMRDRFGPPPEEAVALLTIASMKVVLRKLRVAQIQNLRDHYYELRFSQLKEVQILRLSEVCRKKPKLMSLTADFKLLIKTSSEKSLMQQCQEILEILIPLTL